MQSSTIYKFHTTKVSENHFVNSSLTFLTSTTLHHPPPPSFPTCSVTPIPSISQGLILSNHRPQICVTVNTKTMTFQPVASWHRSSSSPPTYQYEATWSPPHPTPGSGQSPSQIHAQKGLSSVLWCKPTAVQTHGR